MRPPPQGLMVGRGALGVRSRSDSWWVKTQSLYSLDPCAGAARRPVIGCPSKLPFDSLSSVKGISTCALPFLSLSKIKTGRDPRGAELEEEAQRGEVGTAWEWRTQNRRG